MNNKHSKSFPITFGDVGPDKHLTLSALVLRFQEVINEHTLELGVGTERVWNEFGGKWVITRMKLEIDRLPQFGETVTIETWPLKPSILIMPRVCAMLDGDGNPVIRAYTEWCVLDIADDSIRRTTTFGYPTQMEHLTDRLISGRPTNPREMLTEAELVYQRTMRYSDLDFNGHVNNVADLRLAIDCFTAAELAEHPVRELEMTYAGQGYEGETISIYRRNIETAQDGSAAHSIIQGRSADRHIFTAMFLF